MGVMDDLKVVIRQRDHLLSLCRKWETPTPEAECRQCGDTMSMRSWSEQYCHICRPEE